MKQVYQSILDHYKDKEYEKPLVLSLRKYNKINYEKKYKTCVRVVNADTLDTALCLGESTLLLNMGNDLIPGNNPILVGAQEEDLFRRTNLHKYLNYKDYPIFKKVILTKNIEVINKGLRKKYEPLDKPYYIDIITCSSIKNNSIGNRLSPINTNVMFDKIFTIFDVAYENSYKKLVLSAFGCGGFSCPPEHVSLIFKNIIGLFDGCFEEIVFAIWDENYPKSNFAIFSKNL